MNRHSHTEAHKRASVYCQLKNKMQSIRTISADPPAEVALIKELVSTSEYKFLLPASQNKLLSIKQLSIWFITVSKMLSRFPDVDSFLFGTVASLNSTSELQLRTVKLEEKGVKLAGARGPFQGRPVDKNQRRNAVLW